MNHCSPCSLWSLHYSTVWWYYNGQSCLCVFYAGRERLYCLSMPVGRTGSIPWVVQWVRQGKSIARDTGSVPRVTRYDADQVFIQRFCGWSDGQGQLYWSKWVKWRLKMAFFKNQDRPAARLWLFWIFLDVCPSVQENPKVIISLTKLTTSRGVVPT